MPPKLTPAEALAIREKRDAEDPCLHYTAPITLQRANECVARYICVHAPNRVGKTSWMQYVTSSVLRGKNPHWKDFGPVKILLIVPKRAQASKIWGDRLLKKCALYGDMGKNPWLPKREVLKVTAAYSPAGSYPGFLEMKNGSSMLTILSGDPNSWKALEGMDFDLVVRDEVAGNENLGDEIQPRLLDSVTRHERGIQPWGGVVLWGATETKHNEEWLAFKQRCIDGVKDHCYFKPIPEEAEAYISMSAREEMKTTMSANSYRIRGSGTLDAGDLVRIFVQQWDDKRHLLPRDYVIRDDDVIVIGWDPGVQHPTGIVIAALTRDAPNQLKVVKVFEHSNETVDYDVECIHSFLLGRRIACFVYDWAAKASHKHAPSLLHTLIGKMDAKGYSPLAGYIQADKRVEPGIDSVRSSLDPHPFNKAATPLLVLNPSNESGGPLLRGQIMGYCKTEPTAGSPGKIVKKNDDALDCLPAGTLIATEFGEVPIEDVRPGDFVWTRKGLRQVRDAWESSDCSDLMEFSANGVTVRATAGHLVWTENRGWITVDSLTDLDTILLCQTSLSSRESNTTSAKARSLGGSVTGTGPSCTEPFGSTTTDQSHREWLSTTGTGIIATTTPRIWSACPSTSTPVITQHSQSDLLTLGGSDHLRSSGTDRQRGFGGTQSTVGMPIPSGRWPNPHANSAHPYSPQSTGEIPASVPMPARLSGGEGPDMTMWHQPAADVALPSCPTSTPSEQIAKLVARPSTPGRVYDLTVDWEHEFFANGVLVHNCLRYLVRAFPYWSSAYCCGPARFAAERPLQADPLRLSNPERPQTYMERREALSKQLGARNKTSIRKMFVPRR